MCVIIVKPAGLDFPPKKELQACWEKNPDGAGFAFRKDGVVHWEKGFMKFKSLWSALEEIPEASKKDAMILHFRIATHSVKDGGNTHPFPISPETEHLRSTSGETDGFVMAHNGVITGLPFDSLLSDTMVFVRDIASKHLEVFTKEDRSTLLVKMVLGANKVVFMSPDQLTTIGDWTTEATGLVWSNTYHRASTVVSYSSSGNRRYVYGDAYDYDYDVGYYERNWGSSCGASAKGKTGHPYDRACHLCEINGPVLSPRAVAYDRCAACFKDGGRKPNFKSRFAPVDKLDKAPSAKQLPPPIHLAELDKEFALCSTCMFFDVPGEEAPCVTCIQEGSTRSGWKSKSREDRLAAFTAPIKPCTGCSKLRASSAVEPCRTCLKDNRRPLHDGLGSEPPKATATEPAAPAEQPEASLASKMG